MPLGCDPAEWALKQRDLFPSNAGQLQRAAQELALCARACRPPVGPPSPEQEAESDRIAGRAVAPLGQAAARSGSSAAALLRDPAFAALADRPDFRALLASIAPGPGRQ